MAKGNFVQKDMSGVLFPNTKKETKNQPDYTGSVTINDTEYRLAGWKKKGTKVNFLSLAVSENDGQGGQGRKNQKEDTDSIPF